MGYFMQCTARAAFTRAIEEGKIAAADVMEDSSSAYAALGTCIHFVLQDGTKCVFPKIANPSPKDIREAMSHYSDDPIATRAALMAGSSRAFQYTQHELETAATLFGGDLDVTRMNIRDCATFAAQYLPKSPDGLPWKAETPCSSKDGTGHIDFLSQDNTVGGDLKTTSKPPPGNRIKPEHLGQLASYALDSGCLKWWVLYVGSMAPFWALRVDIDFTTDAGAEYLERVRRHRTFLRGPKLYDMAIPQLGAHCSDGFCPFKKACKDRYLPEAGVKIEQVVRNKNPIGAMTL
jgi:hypothetical protein